MILNLPILESLSESQNILIAGSGGGFDIFAGLPIYFTLRQHGKSAHLANYSQTPLELVPRIAEVEVLIENTLIGAKGTLHRPTANFPEGYLAEWFKQEYGDPLPIWMFPNLGVVPVRQAYEKLVEHLSIDALIIVEGGVDSLMRGDEETTGTQIEDAITLAAVKSLDIPVKIQACIGFGAEVESGLCHHLALENMAALVKAGAFLGSCALVPGTEVFLLYEHACRYVWQKPNHIKSHISTRVIPAVHGEFGNFHMYPPDESRDLELYISPLMSLYWFFDANTVIAHNYAVDVLHSTHTKNDVFSALVNMKQYMQTRPCKDIPY